MRKQEMPKGDIYGGMFNQNKKEISAKKYTQQNSHYKQEEQKWSQPEQSTLLALKYKHQKGTKSNSMVTSMTKLAQLSYKQKILIYNAQNKQQFDLDG